MISTGKSLPVKFCDHGYLKKIYTKWNYSNFGSISLGQKRYKIILAQSRGKGKAWAKRHGWKSDEFKIVTPRNFDANMRGMSNCDLYYAGEHVEFVDYQWNMLSYASR